jgi:hypothetical protein
MSRAQLVAETCGEEKTQHYDQRACDKARGKAILPSV